MVSADEKAKFNHIASLSGWDVAREFGCSYSGDSNPINHNGFFYDSSDWEEDGYAKAVEFWEDPDTHALIVQTGTINCPDDLDKMMERQGFEDNEVKSNKHAQIECVMMCSGMERDGIEYPGLKSFDLETWAEWRIWRSIAGWLENLREG